MNTGLLKKHKLMSHKIKPRYNVYGVMVTSIEEMLFSKYIVINNIAMNTKNVEERKMIVQTWLDFNKKTQD
jgi:hypothetical protein